MGVVPVSDPPFQTVQIRHRFNFPETIPVFIVTNREIDPAKTGLALLTDRLNRKAADELRIVEVTGSPEKPKVEFVPDELPPAFRRKAKISDIWLKGMGLDPADPVYGSVYVAHQVLSQSPAKPKEKRGTRTQGRNLLFFVHGFNNDLADVVGRAMRLEDRYGVQVIAFSWPAHAGRAGVLNYRNDKTTAKQSVGALDRTLAKAAEYFERFAASRRQRILDAAWKTHEENGEARNARLTELAEQECPYSINLMLHSMGNYLYKHLLYSSASFGKRLVFDNVTLVAADTNNLNHAEWIAKIRARRRVFITINEHDEALYASRMKFGDEQYARLGHYPYHLDAEDAVYVDFTDAKYVCDSHSYFEGKPLCNKQVETFFDDAFNGHAAEKKLYYDTARGTYRMDQDRHSAR